MENLTLAAWALKPGTEVQIRGMKTSTFLNGQAGVCLRQSSKGNFVVRLECGDRTFDVDNLVPVAAGFHRPQVPVFDDVRTRTSSTDSPFPRYWTNINPEKGCFEEQYQICNEAKDMFEKFVSSSMGLSATLVRARRVESSWMWADYVGYKDALRSRLRLAHGGKCQALKDVSTQERLKNDAVHGGSLADSTEDELNEVFLWHGTSRDAVESIARDGFDLSVIKHGKAFGRGIYFTDHLDKALPYSEEHDGVKFILLCRVCCGDVWHTQASTEPNADKLAREAVKDTVVANPLGLGQREFVIPQREQTYPEFVLEVDVTLGVSN